MASARTSDPRTIEAYHELQAYSVSLGDAEFIHQHVVDAWAAQQADDSTKPITLAFALAGFYLHIEKGLTGRQVQRMHMRMARRRRDWPRFPLPDDRGAIAVEQVVAQPPGPARNEAIEAWCRSVWNAYHASRQEVIDMLRGCGIE